jgi:hypothetical protein
VPRSVRTFLPVVGDPVALAAAFDGDPARWLPGARRDGPDRFILALRAGSLTRTVRAAVGAPWRAGATRWRALSWDPISEDGEHTAMDRLLPSLDGELGLHAQSGGRTTLVLDARYRPPGGALGGAMDAVAMHRLARTTVERFLEEVTARLAGEALLLDDGPNEPAPAGRSAAGDGPANDRTPVGTF